MSTEESLAELERIIRGEIVPHLGPGLRTYPTSTDEKARRMFAECLTLEQQGKVYRHLDEPDCVIWMPVANNSD